MPSGLKKNLNPKSKNEFQTYEQVEKNPKLDTLKQLLLFGVEATIETASKLTKVSSGLCMKPCWPQFHWSASWTEPRNHRSEVKWTVWNPIDFIF